MPHRSIKRRSDIASRKISATSQIIYEAFLDKEDVAAWRPPQGMKCQIYEFDPRPNGIYEMSVDYIDLKHDVVGKSSPHSDKFKGQFVALVPYKRIVELVEFETDDPLFMGAMTVTTILEPVDGGIEVFRG
jgi:uncharacterized protein YndB with AHSA1/START domain